MKRELPLLFKYGFVLIFVLISATADEEEKEEAEY